MVHTRKGNSQMAQCASSVFTDADDAADASSPRQRSLSLREMRALAVNRPVLARKPQNKDAQFVSPLRLVLRNRPQQTLGNARGGREGRLT
jgi:hypothetical protein